MANIILKTQSNYDGEEITIEWRDLVGKRIPDVIWRQVHIVCNFNGKVVLVYLDKLGMYHLPGGHVEVGEDVEEKLFMIEVKSEVKSHYSVVATTYEEAVQQIKNGEEDYDYTEQEFVGFELLDVDRW